jgi:hypothetical protein
MAETRLPMIVNCTGGLIANRAFQHPTDPIFQVMLETQDGHHYVLPLSERGCAKLVEVISKWRQFRDFMSEQEPPEPSKRQ